MTVKNDLDSGVKNFTPADSPRTVKSIDGVERTFQPRLSVL